MKTGKATKLTNFGVFVELEPGLEGLLDISELADHKVESPEDVVKLGDEIEVKLLRIDVADRKIGLSRKQVGRPETEAEAAELAAEASKQAARPRDKELRGGTSGGDQLFSIPETAPEGATAEEPKAEEAKPEEEKVEEPTARP